MASIKLSFKFEYEFCPTNDYQDGRQNGPHLSVSAVVVTLTLIGFLPNFIQAGFHQTLIKLEYRFCRTNDKMAAPYQFAFVDTGHSTL